MSNGRMTMETVGRENRPMVTRTRTIPRESGGGVGKVWTRSLNAIIQIAGNHIRGPSTSIDISLTVSGVPSSSTSTDSTADDFTRQS